MFRASWSGRAGQRGLRMGLVCACLLGCGLAGAADKPGFNRDIRPILVETCFPCHGPDSASRKADLRLDQREAAVKAGAIVPRKPDESELISRVFSEDADERMPPPSSHKTLTAEQKGRLREWIAAGAEYQPHWSFIPPMKPRPPAIKPRPLVAPNAAWIKNPIDNFILAKLREHGLQPAPEADRRTLARRASLDVTGLPPRPAEVEAFVNDQSPDAYEKYVDRLLQSPRWGEHRAHYWLDAARYADTNGIHFDNFREAWAYRDWLIAAFNRNQPFDQFTVEQLAGDLLPNPTLQQQVATGFNRCNATTNEGGVIPEEYAVLYTRDRTETASRVWMGLTAGCAVCHDHKFDPLSQKEFYAMSAFFNNTTQPVMDGNVKNTPPTVFVPAQEDRERWTALEKEIAELKSQPHEKPSPELAAKLADLEKEQKAILARGTKAHVMQERKESPVAHLLFRGEYDQRREQVSPSTPAFLPPMNEKEPKNRLGFAQWLLRPEHPLTARVAVNRFWQEVFGTGLVRSTEDFGTTGELPSHPELLDWLAVEFRESGWDVKKLFRLMLTSAAYRQAAVATPEKLEKDPQNRLVSRGPRFRMEAEMVRDYALAAGGLLVEKIGGASVKPYQPEGVWEAVAMPESNTRFYKRDGGDAIYRRSLYTFWKRSAPPASMEILNAPTREACIVRRERTNTPLQALVTLNDPQFVEAARNLAQAAIKEGGPTVEGRLDFAARRLLARPLRPDECGPLLATFQDLLRHYQAHGEDAKALVAVGQSKADASLDAPTLAAWTMTVNTLMNLDEVLNK